MNALDTLCAAAIASLPTLGQLELAARALIGDCTVERTSEEVGRAGDSLAVRTVVVRRGALRLSVFALYLDRREADGAATNHPVRGRGPAGIIDIRATLVDERVEAANSKERAKKRPNRKNLRNPEVYSNGGTGATDGDALAEFARNADIWWRNPHSPVPAALSAA